MDELDAVETAQNTLVIAEYLKNEMVTVHIDVLRALLARATRSHD